MGKYRTFSKKVTHLNGALDPKGRYAQGSVPRNYLLVQKRSEWSWRKESSLYSCTGILNLALILCIIASLAALQPCVAAPTTAEADNTLSTATIFLIQNPTGSQTTENPLFSTEETPRNCTRPSSEDFPTDLFTKEQRQHGAIVLHFFAVTYLLYALFLVCDAYFVPTIECICQELHISPNVAGATFMAISTSAPELFTNVIGTFITKGDLGVGTIVGSAVFNVLAVGTCVGIGTNIAVKTIAGSRNKKKGVPLEWWSLSRDTAYYMLSVTILIAVLYDGKVYWFEAAAMILVYGVYILGMCYDAQCKEFAQTCCEKVRNLFGCEKEPRRKLSRVLKHKILKANESSPLISQEVEKHYGAGNAPCTEKKHSHRLSLAEVISGPVHGESSLDSSSFSSQSSTTTDSSIMSTVSTLGVLKDVLSFPIRLMLRFTIPDCRKSSMKRWYPISLICCVGWIGGLSYLISWMVCIIGETFEIPDSVSGLTFLAAGTSIPEVISSIIVSRQGLGSMGFSNSIGSNTFDVLVCLGLPWLIQSVILTSHDNNFISIHSAGLEYSTILLVTSMIILYILIAMNDYVLDTKIGVACLLMYLVFITVACLLEMNMFFPVNLPPC